MQFYNRTCDKVFSYAFELCLNHGDALLVSREAYIDMYFEIGTLRSAPNVDYWQRKQVDLTMRYLARTGKLSLIHEKSLMDAADVLSVDEKEDLWRRINRTIDLDPWRMVPVPGKSSVLSVLLDQAVSEMSYMSVVDIARIALIAVLILAAIGGGSFGAYYLLSRRGGGSAEVMEEIFLDERSYTDYNEKNGVQVSEEEIEALIKDAFGGLEDEGGLTGSANKASHGAAGEAVFTSDEEINEKLRQILLENTDESMSDAQKLWALYDYVGQHIRYAEVKDHSDDNLTLLKFYFASQTGDSRHYAALFKALCNAAGYECEVMKGRFILNADTEFQRDVLHYWNRMRLNGMYYYFDCEADCDAFGTEVREYYFMATDGNNKWSIWNRDHDAG